MIFYSYKMGRYTLIPCDLLLAGTQVHYRNYNVLLLEVSINIYLMFQCAEP